MNERFIDAMEYAFSAGWAYNQADFAEKIGVGRSVLSGIKNGYKDATPYYMELVAKAFNGLNASWLLTGEGEMLVSDAQRVGALEEPHEFSPDQIEKAQELADRLGVELIPMFSEPFRGGNEGYNLIESWNEIESFWTLPGIAADMIITVTGNSMAPIFPQGSHLAVSKFHFRPDEPFSIPFGEVFAIALRDPDEYEASAVTSYVKRLYRHPDPAKSKTHWIARSENDKYDDFEVPISHIASLWRVRASIAYYS